MGGCKPFFVFRRASTHDAREDDVLPDQTLSQLFEDMSVEIMGERAVGETLLDLDSFFHRSGSQPRVSTGSS